MTREEFEAALKQAVAFNASLPDWQRGVLVDAAKATVDVPRTPVDNHGDN